MMVKNKYRKEVCNKALDLKREHSLYLTHSQIQYANEANVILFAFENIKVVEPSFS